MKLGVYVGTFNPPHNGHLKVVRYLLENEYVDKVLILPTPAYWDKTNLVELKHRINMLKFYEEEKIVIDTIHNNYPYTYQVLESIKKDYPKDSLYLIIGSDNLIHFNKWKNIDKILTYKIIVMNRGTGDLNSYIEPLGEEHFIVINDFPYIDISSTEIRLGKEENMNREVLNYIKKNNLYQ